MPEHEFPDAPAVRRISPPGVAPAEYHARAFEGFYTTKPGGTGLGLTIVRRLIQDAGGRLRVETALGAGSRFIVELPTARSRR